MASGAPSVPLATSAHGMRGAPGPQRTHASELPTARATRFVIEPRALACAIANTAVFTKAEASGDFLLLNSVNVAGRSLERRATSESVSAAPIPAPTKSVGACPAGRALLFLELEPPRWLALGLGLDFVVFGRGWSATSSAPIALAGLGIDSKALDCTPSLNELHDEDDERDDQQKMKRAAQGVRSCQTYSPEYEQNDDQSP